MFCDKCGSQVEAGEMFCNNCGNQMTENGAAAPIVKGAVSKKKILRIVLLVCMVCFFLPFVTVSCGGQSVTANGFETATGIFGDDVLAEGNHGPNVFVLISLLATLGATVLVFIKKEIKLTWATVLSAVSAVCIILFMVTFTGYYDLGSDAEMLEIEYKIGLWAVLILNIGSAILARMAHQEETSDVESIEESIPPVME